MGLPSSVLKWVFVFIVFLFDYSFGYLSKGGHDMEEHVELSKGFATILKRNVSEFRSFTFRIDPSTIHRLNFSTATLELTMSVENDTPSVFPVFIFPIQRHEVIPIKLPHTIQTPDGPFVRYISAVRTLCFADQRLDDQEGHIFVKVSTGSPQLIGFRLKIIVQDNLQLRLDESRTFSITPISPNFVHLPFHLNMSQNVVIKVSSNNDNCMAIGIQKPIGRVFYPDNTFRLRPGGGNNWEIVSQTGAVRVDMREYLNGFYIKLLLFDDDSLCGKVNSYPMYRRRKNVTLQVQNDLPMSLSNGHFWFQISVPPILSLVVGVLIGGLYLITYSCTRRRMLACRTYNVNKAENQSVSLQRFSQHTKPPSYGKWTIIITLLYSLPIFEQAIYNGLISKGAGLFGTCSYNSLCSHPFWIFKDFNHLWSNISYLILGCCFTLISLVKKCVRNTGDQEEGVQYFIGLYYAMGFGLIAKGVLSFAYHFCPSQSNFQYDIIYLSMLIAICQLKVSEFRRPNTFSVDFSCGIVAAIFLTSTLGITFERYLGEWDLAFFICRIIVSVFQGIFIFYAAVYAIYIGYPINRLPNRKGKDEVPLQQTVASELRQQTTFIASNSNNINERPKNQNAEDDDDFMKSFGEIPIFLWIFPKLWSWKLPKFRFERILYVLALLGLNGYLIYFSLTVNYCLYVLIFMAANCGLNIVYYLLMKIIFGEFTCTWKSLQVFIYFLLALGLGAASGYFFFKNISEWSQPTSHSRSEDEACTWLAPYPFYDKHDAWHFLSAHASFFAFMVLLCIDDGVEDVNREYLLVF